MGKDGRYGNDWDTLRSVAVFCRPSFSSFRAFCDDELLIHPTFPTDFDPTILMAICYGVSLKQPVCCADAIEAALYQPWNVCRLTFVSHQLTIVVDRNGLPCYGGYLAEFVGKSASKKTLTLSLWWSPGCACMLVADKKRRKNRPKSYTKNRPKTYTKKFPDFDGVFVRQFWHSYEKERIDCEETYEMGGKSGFLPC